MMRLKHALLLVGLLLLLAHAGVAQELPPFKKVKVTDFITASLPENFTTMTEADLNNKYRSYRYPLAMYSDVNRTVDLGFNRSFTNWRPQDIALVQSFYKASVLNLYTDVDMITDEIQTINGRSFVVFEFVGTVKDEAQSFRSNRVVSKYIYVMYTIYDNNTLVVNFNAPARYKDQWQPTVRQVMQSVALK